MNISTLELKHLRLINSIVEFGSLSLAADRLCLTQSAVSKQLKELESSLGFAVFNRTRLNWTLTNEGEKLFSLSSSVLELISDSLDQLNASHSNLTYKLKIGSDCFYYFLLLSTFWARLNKVYPNVEIDLKVDESRFPINKVLSRELDFCFTSQVVENEVLEYLPFLNDEIIAIDSMGLFEGSYLTPKDFERRTLLVHSLPLNSVPVYPLFLKPAGIVPRNVKEIPLTELALQMVANQQGILTLPRWMLSEIKLKEDHRILPIGERGLRRQIFLCYLKDNSMLINELPLLRMLIEYGKVV